MTHPNSITGDSKPRLWYCPVDFDAAACLPTRLQKYSQEAQYLLGLIRWQQVMRFNRLGKARLKAPVPLKAAYLRRVIGRRHYTAFMGALKDKGAITCDEKHCAGRHSYSYGLGPLFGRRYHQCLITKKKIINALARKDRDREENLSPVDLWLKANLKRIALDPQAYQAADNTDHPDDAHMLLTAIEGGGWRYTTDPYGRRHTNITNLNRSLRKYLTVDVNHLISLDISASQPIILGLKMLGRDVRSVLRPRPYVLRRQQTNGGGPTSKRVHDIAAPPSPLPSLNDGTFSDTHQQAKQRFLKHAQDGTLYERFAAQTGHTRDRVKRWVLGTIFCNPKQKVFPLLDDVMDAYQTLYPGVLEWSITARERDYRKLNHDVQRDEAYVIFNLICERIHRQRPDIFIATIHV
jgi:hypothetical protein